MKKKMMIGAAAALTIIFVIVMASIALNSGLQAQLIIYDSNGREIQASSLSAGETFSANINIDLTQKKEYKNTIVTLDIPDGVFLDEVQESDIVQEVVKEDGKAIIYLNSTFRAPVSLVVRTTMQVAKSGTDYAVLTGSVKSECGSRLIEKSLNKERFGEINP